MPSIMVTPSAQRRSDQNVNVRNRLYMFILKASVQKRSSVVYVIKSLTIPNIWMITFLSVRFLSVVIVVVETLLKNIVILKNIFKRNIEKALLLTINSHTG